MDRYTIGVIDPISSTALIEIRLTGGGPGGQPISLTNAELNTVADAFLSLLNTKWGVTNLEVPGMTRTDSANVDKT